MNTSAKLSHVEIDDHATTVIDRFDAGDLTEDEARRQLAELAHRSGIVAEIAENRTSQTDVDKSDVQSDLAWLVTRKIMTPGTNHYDFSKARGRSLSGYVRNLAMKSFSSVRRNTTLDSRKHQIPVPLTAADGEISLSVIADNQAGLGRTGEAFRNPTLSAPPKSVDDNERTEDVELPEHIQRLMRVEEFRPHVQSTLLRAAFSLPAAVRPGARSMRHSLVRRLNGADGDALAVASLKAHAADSTDVSEATQSLMGLWEDFSTEDARVLLAAGVEAVATVAMSAVADWPRPSAERATVARNALAGELRVSSPALVPLVPALVNAAIANECVPFSSTVRESLRGPMRAAFDEANAQYRPLLSEVATIAGSPWGSRPTDVAAKLRDTVVEFSPMPNMRQVAAAAVDGLNLSE